MDADVMVVAVLLAVVLIALYVVDVLGVPAVGLW